MKGEWGHLRGPSSWEVWLILVENPVFRGYTRGGEGGWYTKGWIRGVNGGVTFLIHGGCMGGWLGHLKALNVAKNRFQML